MRTLWIYRRTTLYGSIALAATAIFAVGVFKGEWLVHRGNAPRKIEHPAVIHQTLTPSNLDQVHSWFGPWATVDSGLVKSDRLVLIQADGSTSASSWSATVDQSWDVTDIPQIDQLTYGGDSVQFTTGGLAIYKVSYDQPFVLEQLPNRVYAFVKHDGKHQIVDSTPRYVKSTGHKA